MYMTLLGKEGFRKGMDLYFERHDGNAVTCDGRIKRREVLEICPRLVLNC